MEVGDLISITWLLDERIDARTTRSRHLCRIAGWTGIFVFDEVSGLAACRSHYSLAAAHWLQQLHQETPAEKKARLATEAKMMKQAQLVIGKIDVAISSAAVLLAVPHFFLLHEQVTKAFTDIFGTVKTMKEQAVLRLGGTSAGFHQMLAAVCELSGLPLVCRNLGDVCCLPLGGFSGLPLVKRARIACGL